VRASVTMSPVVARSARHTRHASAALVVRTAVEVTAESVFEEEGKDEATLLTLPRLKGRDRRSRAQVGATGSQGARSHL